MSKFSCFNYVLICLNIKNKKTVINNKSKIDFKIKKKKIVVRVSMLVYSLIIVLSFNFYFFYNLTDNFHIF